MPAAIQPHPHRRALLLIPIVVLLTIHPLIIHGPSCGQDLAFHIQSWLDAAHQLRHGHYPHWDATAAWNAGEPRFLFYPPISWLLGALLTLIFPINLCPTIFIAIALLTSGLAFYKLASHFTSPNAALIASTLYLTNPYMLFCAFERSALAELLAAAWIPLLLLALLHRRPTIPGIALPLALLWLTNAPAAVIGSYTLALLATLRVLHSLTASSSRPKQSAVGSPLYSFQATPTSSPSTTINCPGASVQTTIRYPEASASGLISLQKKRGSSPCGTPLRLTLTYLSGAILGLTLPAFYLLPAAYERRFIQVSMAIIPNMRYQDNFLFTHTSDAAHNAVNHTISALALTLLIITTLSLCTLYLNRKKLTSSKLTSKNLTRKESVILSDPERSEGESKDPEALHAAHTANPFLPQTLTLLTITIAFLLTPISTPIWQHLPDLAYLQFPWRFLTLLTPILALTLALLLDTIPGTLKLSPPAQGTLTLLLPLALTAIAYHLYHQPPDPTDDPPHLAQLFTTHHGFPPTDEYTPTLADNDPLRTDNPAYWLLPLNKSQPANPNTPAPNTTPTAAELNPTLDTDDTPIPDTQTLSTPAPHHLTLNLTEPTLLVLNLRNYPNWQITTTNPTNLKPSTPNLIIRNDGLITIPLPTGPTTLNITWHRTPDQTLGLILSALSLLILTFTLRRRIFAQSRPDSRRPRRTHVESRLTMNSEVQALLTTGAALTDAALERLLPSATTEPHSIHRAMRHSVFAGGKRLRPILCMEAARMVAGTGNIPEGAAELGAAIEMAHTYSLIHDDLPALDNDDLRRGQPTCHVAFGEAIAILAGDALQNLAFQVISNLPAPPATVVAILHDFALAIGTGVGSLSEAQSTALPPGMIGGQVVDIESEGQHPTPELVERIHRAKTGALFTTSILCGGLLGLGHTSYQTDMTPNLSSRPERSVVERPATPTRSAPSSTDIITALRTFGESAGLAFQIVDDILDMTQTSAELGKTAGKDTAATKATWPAVYGIEQSKHDAAALIADAFAALAPFGEAATPLKSLAQYLVDRTH